MITTIPNMKNLLIIAFIILGPVCRAQTEIQYKVYNTEFGRFDLWFHGKQITGSYKINPKDIIGSIITELDGLIAEGRWKDPDGTGDIVLIFEEGLEKFRADYRSDKEPDKWYRDQWHGIRQGEKEETKAPCTGGSYDLIKPFIGTWEEFELEENDNEEFIGTLKVKLAAGGCALVQRFTSPDSSFTYSTQGHVDKGSGFWEEQYVFSTGSTANYQWIVDKGDIVQRRVGGSRQIDYIHQLRFTELDESGYLVLVEQSTDGGKTWELKERTRVKRKE